MQFSWLNLAIIVFLAAGTLLGAMPLIGATLLAPGAERGPHAALRMRHYPTVLRGCLRIYYFYALLF
jgi:hypothetical protein